MSKDGEIGFLFLVFMMVVIQFFQLVFSGGVHEVRIVGEQNVHLLTEPIRVKSVSPVDVKIKNSILDPASIKIDNADSVRSDCSCHYGNGE